MPITVSGNALTVLDELTRKTSDFAPLFGKIGIGLVESIRIELGKGRTPWGEPFAPLGAAGKLQRFRGKTYTKLGDRTTSAFTRHVLGNHVPLNDTRKHIYDRINFVATEDGVIIGIMDSENSKIGRVHQFGATIKPKKGKFLVFQPPGFAGPIFAREVIIPARPYLPIRNRLVDLPAAWTDDISSVILKYLTS